MLSPFGGAESWPWRAAVLEAVKTNPGGHKEVLAELSFLRDYKCVYVLAVKPSGVTGRAQSESDWAV